jgi:DNA-directed RNA polymerase subunit beta'
MKTKNTKIVQVESIRIGLASPDHIKQWAERTLPNGKIVGQITSSQTVNYKTLKPEKGGLFCERIFGPVNDFECACGRKKTKTKQKFCPDCDVEFTSSRVRRHRLGFIQLVSPVTHVWYLKGRPSYISILLDMPKKKVEAITYCTETLNSSYNYSSVKKFTNFFQSKKSKTYFSLSTQNSSWEIHEDWTYFLYYMTAPIEKEDIPIQPFLNDNSPEVHYSTQQLGAEAIRDLLINLDFAVLERELRVQLFFINEDITDLENEIKNLENQGYILFEKEQQQLKKFLYRQLQLLIYSRAKKLRRLKLVRQFRRTKSRPEWMILSILPVLPPELRPIIQLDGDQVAVSDLNKLYQKVLFRNNRVKRNSSIKSDEMKYAQRLLQEAVDALIENGKGGADPICASNDRPLKSLSDMLKGKKGRFRQNLLGKRVDYSGRSVIVVGPRLKLHECGLPKELAVELFQPFLIRNLMSKKIVRTIVGAKRLIQQQDPIIWKILEQVMQNHPVLLNRAPTLHRVGFQAFQPKLVEGRAILLHPLVCTAFNADFDGDQMAVHVPLCFEARAEAWVLMWSRNNILSPATGQPMIIPSQDMVLGCYYLTTTNLKIKSKENNHFIKLKEALKVFNTNQDLIHSLIWIRWNNLFETNNEKEKPIEIQIQSNGIFMEIYSSYRRQFDFSVNLKNQYIRTTLGRVIMNKQIQETIDK